jgi:hypothetical protein
LHEDGQGLAEYFICQFRGRLLGLVIHDRPGASVCIDIGRIGIRESRRRLAQMHTNLDIDTLRREAERAPELISDVQSAIRSSRQVVLDMIQAIGKSESHCTFICMMAILSSGAWQIISAS